MTKVTRKPWQPRRVAMRFASRMKGKKKTLCQWRYRGSVKVRWLHLHSPCYSLTLLPKPSTLPLPGTKAFISPHPFFMKSPFQFRFFFFFFNFTILYWFCHTLTWIHHRCAWVPNPETPSYLPPHINSLGHPSVPAPNILYPVSNLD